MTIEWAAEQDMIQQFEYECEQYDEQEHDDYDEKRFASDCQRLGVSYRKIQLCRGEYIRRTKNLTAAERMLVAEELEEKYFAAYKRKKKKHGKNKKTKK